MGNLKDFIERHSAEIAAELGIPESIVRSVNATTDKTEENTEK